MDEDGVTYFHGAQLGEMEHSPDPVAAPDAWRGVCDFCLADRAEWVLPAKIFTAPVIGHLSAEDWMACDICAELIEKDQWNRLTQRAVTYIVQRHPELATETAEVQTSVKAQYRMLRKNITGGLRHL